MKSYGGIGTYVRLGPEFVARPATKIDYASLNGKQQEAYNFQKFAAVLADYGFNCIKLADDWKGADFIALHIDGTTLRVQLKGRPTIDKKYCGKDLWMAFRVEDRWYLVPHDELVRIVDKETSALKSKSWQNKGRYTWPKPPQRLLTRLDTYIVPPA